MSRLALRVPGWHVKPVSLAGSLMNFTPPGASPMQILASASQPAKPDIAPSRFFDA